MVSIINRREWNYPLPTKAPTGRRFKMNVQEALNVFGLSGELTEQDIKTTYKKMALKYHPDRNPLGDEMMKAVNAAFDFLIANINKINQFQSNEESARYNYGEELENVLNILSCLAGVIYEIIGNWMRSLVTGFGSTVKPTNTKTP
ncbi:DnaJ-like protein [Candidatus Regiella insecticola LSR1]|uniref:DnaJ-like protein n=1 Tax=Candidatus Regiella insecticola LSR1 TaxID=663321 RepID=E0WV33_9ENTR|nr:DnaJ-like protein [Candidatus Regiella insecticola LSR1]